MPSLLWYKESQFSASVWDALLSALKKNAIYDHTEHFSATDFKELHWGVIPYIHLCWEAEAQGKLLAQLHIAAEPETEPKLPNS